MKKTIASIFMLLLMSMSVFAYGGGGAGMIVPTAIYAKYLSIDEPKMLWTPPYIKDGMVRKIDTEGIPLKQVTFNVDKTNYGRYFLVVSKNDVKEDEYASWHIDSDVGKIKSVELQFVVEKKWLLDNPNWQLTKDEVPIDVDWIAEDETTKTYKTTITSFSDFVIKAVAESKPSGSGGIPNSVDIPVGSNTNEPVEVQSQSTMPTEQKTEPPIEKNSSYWKVLLFTSTLILAVGIIGHRIFNRKKEETDKEDGQ